MKVKVLAALCVIAAFCVAPIGTARAHDGHDHAKPKKTKGAKKKQSENGIRFVVRGVA
jgi:hypothetical protein